MTVQLILDLGDELTTALANAEELLLQASPWEDDMPEITWPEPLADGRALDAVRRLWDAVAPTQGCRAAGANLGRILAPDGRYEHVPLRLAAIDPAGPAVLSAAAAIFRDPDAPDHIRQALQIGAEIAYGHGDDQACARLAVTTERLAGLLNTWPPTRTAGTWPLLSGHARTATSCSPRVATRPAARANRIWQAGDPLHLWQY